LRADGKFKMGQAPASHEGGAMSGIKSSYEIAMEKMKQMGIEEPASLSRELKESIEKIKKEYDAKIAEKKILLSGEENLAAEIQFLERERERKIKAIYDHGAP